MPPGLVVNSVGTTPLAGGSGIGISTSDSGIPKNSIGKTSEKNVVPVEKLESEFPILEFRYIIYVGLSIITQCQEITRHKGPPKIKDTLFYWVHSGVVRGGGLLCDHPKPTWYACFRLLADHPPASSDTPTVG